MRVRLINYLNRRKSLQIPSRDVQFDWLNSQWPGQSIFGSCRSWGIARSAANRQPLVHRNGIHKPGDVCMAFADIQHSGFVL